MNAHNIILEKATDCITSNEVLRNNGRSFYWARFFLGEQAAENATRLYSFCRYLDDVADGDIAGGLPRLQSLRNQLNGNEKIHDRRLLNYLSLYEDKQAAKIYALNLLEGLISDQGIVSLTSDEELIRYGYFVAGTVGLMMSPFLGVADTKALPFAIDLGVALQLTNICRDVLEDAESGRRYIPVELTTEQICTASEDPESDNAKLIAEEINRILDIADGYYQSGLEGLYFLSPQAQKAIAVTAMVYRQIGIKLRENNTDWFNGRTVVSSFEKISPTMKALFSVNEWIRNEPSHKVDLHTHLRDLPGANGLSHL